jgi:hypothetical protein
VINPEHDLSLDACMTIRKTCPVAYKLDGSLTEFRFGGPSSGLTVVFDPLALRELVELGTEALVKLHALHTVGPAVAGEDELLMAEEYSA